MFTEHGPPAWLMAHSGERVIGLPLGHAGIQVSPPSQQRDWQRSPRLLLHAAHSGMGQRNSMLFSGQQLAVQHSSAGLVQGTHGMMHAMLAVPSSQVNLLYASTLESYPALYSCLTTSHHPSLYPAPTGANIRCPAAYAAINTLLTQTPDLTQQQKLGGLLALLKRAPDEALTEILAKAPDRQLPAAVVGYLNVCLAGL